MLQRLEAKAKKRSRRARPVIAMANKWAPHAFVSSGVAAALNYGWETGVTASADPIVWLPRETMRVGDGGAE